MTNNVYNKGGARIDDVMRLLMILERASTATRTTLRLSISV